MTWREFTGGLATVARMGTTQGLTAETVASLRGLEMIAGSEGDNSGVVLTEVGRGWYQTAVVDRETERLAVQYTEVMERFYTRGYL